MKRFSWKARYRVEKSGALSNPEGRERIEQLKEHLYHTNDVLRSYGLSDNNVESVRKTLGDDLDGFLKALDEGIEPRRLMSIVNDRERPSGSRLDFENYSDLLGHSAVQNAEGKKTKLNHNDLLDFIRTGVSLKHLGRAVNAGIPLDEYKDWCTWSAGAPQIQDYYIKGRSRGYKPELLRTLTKYLTTDSDIVDYDEIAHNDEDKNNKLVSIFKYMDSSQSDNKKKIQPFTYLNKIRKAIDSGSTVDEISEAQRRKASLFQYLEDRRSMDHESSLKKQDIDTSQQLEEFKPEEVKETPEIDDKEVEPIDPNLVSQGIKRQINLKELKEVHTRGGNDALRHYLGLRPSMKHEDALSQSLELVKP